MEQFRPYIELSKPRIVSMVLVTTTIGFFLGGQGIVSGWLLLYTLIGTGLAAAGAAALNNYIERDLDGSMNRTRHRALPAGKLDPANALAYGVCFILAGVTILACKVNLLAAFVVLLTAFLYVLVYTPMKKVSWLNTSIGAIPGALPPVSGWVAASGEMELGVWVLFLILFMWQHPHFFSIAWMYRDDYKRADLKMLPVIEPSGRRMFRLTVVYAVALVAASALLTLMGLTGWVYLVGALILGSGVVAMGINMANKRSLASAKHLLRATVFYLPVLLVLIIVDARF